MYDPVGLQDAQLLVDLFEQQESDLGGRLALAFDCCGRVRMASVTRAEDGTFGRPRTTGSLYILLDVVISRSTCLSLLELRVSRLPIRPVVR